MSSIALCLLILTFIFIFLRITSVYFIYRNKNKYSLIIDKQKREFDKLYAESELLSQDFLVKSNEMAKSEKMLLLLIKNSNDIFVVVNEKGEQRFISAAAERITGYTVKELMGNIEDVIYPDDIDIVRQHWQRMIANKNKADTIQYRHKHKKKGYIWVETVAQNFLDEPAINAVVANVRDISEKKRIEAELIKSNIQKQQLLVFEIDRVSHELKANQQTMMLASLKFIQNSERDIQIVEKLKEIESTESSKNKKRLSSLIAYFKHSSSVSNWNEFEILFKSIHPDFYEKLNTMFPHLTPNERKICAFLKLNMSSKDISLITFQSESALKKARLRLRKKLQLDRETNLSVFLQNI